MGYVDHKPGLSELLATLLDSLRAEPVG